jgi:Holliday junction resolvase
MNTKSKGSIGERELIHEFWAKGWAAFRAAGSGSNKYPCPDIIAGNVLRKLGIECKVTKSDYQFFKREQIDDLRSFCVKFGAESWVAIKFENLNFYFLSLEDLKETKTGFVVRKVDAETKGFFLDEVIE